MNDQAPIVVHIVVFGRVQGVGYRAFVAREAGRHCLEGWVRNCRDGTVEAYRLTVLQDVGAYPSMGAFLPFMTRTMAPGTYVIPKVECNIKSVMTNTTPIEAYRGAGRPEATAAIERAICGRIEELGQLVAPAGNSAEELAQLRECKQLCGSVLQLYHEAAAIKSLFDEVRRNFGLFNKCLK